MDFYNAWSTWFKESLKQTYQASIDFIPNILSALLLIFVGWVIAKLIEVIILKAANRVDRFLKISLPSMQTKWPISSVVGAFCFWLILLFFASLATETLGLPKVSTFLRQFFAYLPGVVSATLIIFLGYALGLKSKETLRGSELEQGELLGQAAWLIIVIFSIILGTAQLGLDTTLLVNLVTIVVATLIGGAALAFGIGASVSVSNIMAAHYIRKTYKAGQKVKIQDHMGIIEDITPVSVAIDTQKGRLHIPAKLFNETLVEQIEE